MKDVLAQTVTQEDLDRVAKQMMTIWPDLRGGPWPRNLVLWVAAELGLQIEDENDG